MFQSTAITSSPLDQCQKKPNDIISTLYGGNIGSHFERLNPCLNSKTTFLRLLSPVTVRVWPQVMYQSPFKTYNIIASNQMLYLDSNLYFTGCFSSNQWSFSWIDEDTNLQNLWVDSQTSCNVDCLSLSSPHHITTTMPWFSCQTALSWIIRRKITTTLMELALTRRDFEQVAVSSYQY